jgi:hypothetical protein
MIFGKPMKTMEIEVKNKCHRRFGRSNFRLNSRVRLKHKLLQNLEWTTHRILSSGSAMARTRLKDSSGFLPME